MKKRNKKDFTLVAQTLLNDIKNDITGESEEYIFGKKPSECVMIGMLGAQYPNDLFTDDEDRDREKFKSIPSIGIRFRVNKEDTHVTVSLKGKLFYRLKTSFEDQIKYLVDDYHKRVSENIVDLDSLNNYIKEISSNPDYVEPKSKIAPVYKSIDLSSIGSFDINFVDIENEIERVNEDISNRIKNKVDEILEFSFRASEGERKISEFLTKERYEALANSCFENARPLWDIKLLASNSVNEKYNECIIQIVNMTLKQKVTNSYESSVFNAGIVIKSQHPFIRIDLNSLKHYYTDDPYLLALGNNCAVVAKDETTIETESVPLVEEHRVVTINDYNEFVNFEKLIADPISNLEHISKEMKKKKAVYDNQLAVYKQRRMYEYAACFEREVIDFDCEIKRFDLGIKMIKNKSDVNKSFELMNRTFAKNKYKGWRMFQIVFIVSEITDMIYSEYKDTPNYNCNNIDNVDLIYFPTGGGKTETFLGCCVFSAFFDRIRGKHKGVTAIIKYPLRLLAAQQLDRVLQLSIYANEIKHEFNIEGEDFSVGLYTGSNNTFNYIKVENRDNIKAMTQKARNDLYRQIDVCPKCGKPMDITFDEQTWTLKHKCTSCGYEPLIYIVDDEIYRYVPTFIVSTIDKMANIGLSNGFKSLFGYHSGTCPKHGLTFNKKCSVPICHEIKEAEEEIKDPIPTLFIQDEMHLVNASLGTFDSHYESMIQYYCEHLVPEKDRKKIKYIGATATISNYDEHIRNLYNKDAKMFPSSVRKENFYSKVDEDDISRIIVGAALYGDSITKSIQKLVTLSRTIVAKWDKDINHTYERFKGLGFDGDMDNLKEVLQYYLIQIIYNNSKNDGGAVSSTISNQGNNSLISEGLPTFNVAEITGDVEFKQIKDVMHNIKEADSKYDCNNVVVATSAISHGVDEEYFNQIYFFGMPNQTSEYIQAYSRVGRTYTGIVFDVFRIVRDRDKSFLKNFYNYHNYKDLLIDPVPINRYAKNAINFTLPGIISALLIQHYIKSVFAIDVTKAIRNNKFTLDDLTNDVLNIYDCNNQESIAYRKIIKEKVKEYYDAFSSNVISNQKISEFIASISKNGNGPMKSLRDVDVTLEVTLGGN